MEIYSWSHILKDAVGLYKQTNDLDIIPNEIKLLNHEVECEIIENVFLKLNHLKSILNINDPNEAIISLKVELEKIDKKINNIEMGKAKIHESSKTDENMKNFIFEKIKESIEDNLNK